MPSITSTKCYWCVFPVSTTQLCVTQCSFATSLQPKIYPTRAAQCHIFPLSLGGVGGGGLFCIPEAAFCHFLLPFCFPWSQPPLWDGSALCKPVRWLLTVAAGCVNLPQVNKGNAFSSENKNLTLMRHHSSLFKGFSMTINFFFYYRYLLLRILFWTTQKKKKRKLDFCEFC